MANKVRTRGPVSARKTSITIQGHSTKRGEKMLNGRYRLVNARTRRVFVGTLIDTINRGKIRIAIFSVPKGEVTRSVLRQGRRSRALAALPPPYSAC